jgi:eukaryotic-like serine/threonine-protein kinase
MSPSSPTLPALLPLELIALQRLLVGRYSIVREIGRGGMGIVALARDVALDRPVAIKLLPPDLATSAAGRARFVQEARTAAALSHPHIIPIHAVEEHEELVFFVMTFVDGETLAERIRRAGPLSSGMCVRVVQEIAWALAHAHANGVVHRDVKPDNVLLERATGRVVVTDFGIARTASLADITAEGEVVGTPRYMSPEQASGEAVDGRSDVYSLGVVAFFAATGRPPFDAPSAAALLMKHLVEPAPPLATVRPGLPARFATAIDRCLAKRPADRWPSAEELATALGIAGGGAHDVPPMVRAFLRESSSAGSDIALGLTAAGTSFVMLALSYYGASGDELSRAFSRMGSLVLYLGIGAAMLGLAEIRAMQLVGRARLLLRRGYSHAAVRAAPIEELDDASDAPPPLGALHIAVRAVATLASLALAMDGRNVWSLFGVAGAIVIPTLTVRRLWSAGSRTAGWWARRIRGRFGELLFRVAGIGLRRDAAPLSAAGEPTAVALRGAVVELYEALGPEQRAALAQLPALATQLERAAVAPRERVPVSFDDRTRTEVVALEMLRLELLRLHTAAGAPTELTSELASAMRIGDRIAEQLRDTAVEPTPS